MGKRRGFREELRLSGSVLRDTATISAIPPPIARYGVFGVSTWPIGCDTPPPFLSVPTPGEHAKWRCDTPPPPPKMGISSILAQYPMKTSKWVRYPPLRYYLEKVLRDMEGYLALGPLRFPQSENSLAIPTLHSRNSSRKCLSTTNLGPFRATQGKVKF